MRGEISRPTRFPVVRAHDERDSTASASGQRRPVAQDHVTLALARLSAPAAVFVSLA
jgi:hypothetical protein